MLRAYNMYEWQQGEKPIAEYQFAKNVARMARRRHLWILVAACFSLYVFVGFATSQAVHLPPQYALLAFAIVRLPMLGIIWLVAFLLRKRIGGKQQMWRLELFEGGIIVCNVMDEWIAGYDEITRVEVRYGDGFCGYDRLELQLTFDNGSEAKTGRCACRGEVVEEAARIIRGKIRAATGNEAGSEEEDRTIRLRQLRKAAKGMAFSVLLIWLFFTGMVAYDYYKGNEREKARAAGLEGQAMATNIQHRSDGEVRIDYVFTSPSGKRTRDWAFFPDSTHGSLEMGAIIPMRYLADDPGIFIPRDAIPFPSPTAWIVIWSLVALTGILVLCSFSGWMLAIARRKVYLLRPGELEDDRIKAGNAARNAEQ